MSNPIEIMNNIPHEINMIAIKGAFHRVPLISGQLHIHSFIPQDIIYHTSNMLLQTQFIIVQFSSVQLLSWVRLFATTWTAARQASLSITNSRSLLKLKSIKLVMPSISSSVVPFSSRLQSFPGSGSFQVSQFFTWGGQVLEFQLQHQSFQRIFMIDFL